jgi:PAS domain S-box-containing protein
MDSLRSPESIHSYFIEQIKDYAIFTIDTKGFITAWNVGAERIKGYSEAEIIGQFYGILHPDEHQQAGMPQRELELALQNGSYETEGWRKRKDGSLFWATVTLTPIFSAEGEHIGYTKITGNITKQKELQDKLAQRQEQALEQKNTELQITNRDLENFIYTASHDLKAPIINIEGLLKALHKCLGSQLLQQERVQQIYGLLQESVDRFKETIGDLTEVSRIDRESLEDLAPIDPGEVLHQVQLDLAPQIAEAKARIETKLDCPSIHFSRKNLKSILYNLLSNAVKYRAPDRTPLIRISCRPQDDYQVLCVEDNGLGMDMHQAEKIFALFKRLHSHVEGTGVGLYMVKKIIENAGGKIEVESQIGVGSTFRVYFKQ